MIQWPGGWGRWRPLNRTKAVKREGQSLVTRMEVVDNNRRNPYLGSNIKGKEIAFPYVNDRIADIVGTNGVLNFEDMTGDLSMPINQEMEDMEKFIFRSTWEKKDFKDGIYFSRTLDVVKVGLSKAIGKKKKFGGSREVSEVIKKLRYIFESKESKGSDSKVKKVKDAKGEKIAQERVIARLQECGPRFTLKLISLQYGTFDTKGGEFEWVHKPEMDTSRRRFFL
ncbi:hypothetical protein Q3G72_023062 [Acer saccharum]|nr:hypothetical protein Q3G72_023062 [Acer saccharum]